MDKNNTEKISIPQVTIKTPSASLIKILQYVLVVSIILYLGQALFIPLSFALLISFVLYPICSWLEDHKFSRPIAILISLSILIIIFFGIIYLLIQQLINFSNEWPALKIKLSQAMADLSILLRDKFNISKLDQQNWIKDLTNFSSSNIVTFIKNAIYSSSVAFVLVFIIPVFSALILYYRGMLTRVLYSFFPEEKKELVHKVLHQTVHTYYNFIKGMAIVYLIVGILNSLGLLIIGVPHPFLFGFMTSVLTFIPYVGIIVGSMLPITVAWITYNSIWYPIYIIMVFTFIQYLEANLIFPMAVSNKLKINTLATLVMIFLGGIIWGASGMILFIPFIAIIKLIADNTESLKSLSTLLGTRNN